MKPSNCFLLGLGYILFIAAMAWASVTTDYDHKIDFLKYRTFSWMTQPHTKNPLMKDRIVGFINDQLQHQDLKLVETGGDLGVAANAATKEEKTLEVFYTGFGGWRWHPGFGSSIPLVETYEVGTLVVDLFDTSTKQIIWHGTASDTLSDKAEKNTKQLQKVIEQMFKQYPGTKPTK